MREGEAAQCVAKVSFWLPLAFRHGLPQHFSLLMMQLLSCIKGPLALADLVRWLKRAVCDACKGLAPYRERMITSAAHNDTHTHIHTHTHARAYIHTYARTRAAGVCMHTHQRRESLRLCI